MKQNKILTTLWDYILMTVGSVIFCMAWTSFVIPNGLASGGLTGLCTIIQYATGGAIPIGWTYPIVNVGLLLLGFLTDTAGSGIYATVYLDNGRKIFSVYHFFKCAHFFYCLRNEFLTAVARVYRH